MSDQDESTIRDRSTETRYGELVPVGGGDPVPLLKKHLLIGRRESCDIVLRFKNVSAHHCTLTLKGGYWYVKDNKSLNGVKVNGARVTQKRVDPADQLTIAKHAYKLMYSPHDLGAMGPPPPDEPVENIMGQSLLQRAGLEGNKARESQEERRRAEARRRAAQEKNRGGSK